MKVEELNAQVRWLEEKVAERSEALKKVEQELKELKEESARPRSCGADVLPQSERFQAGRRLEKRGATPSLA